MKLQDILLREIAFFPNCHSRKSGTNVPLSEFLNGTKNGNWRQAILDLRQAAIKSKAYDQLKRKLPCFMLSASTATGGHKASDIKQHSGLLQVDIDGPGDFDASELRDRLAGDPHVLAAWISPGGVGVKAIMLCPADLAKHREAFNAASAYLRDGYGVQVDRQCSDPCRLCFVSWDADFRLNPTAMVLPLPERNTEPAAEAPCPQSSSSLLPPSISILHNTEDFFEEYPALKPIYDLHVSRRIGTPQRGLRNAALVELVASNFCVVHPHFIINFSNEFYRSLPAIFTDYPHGKWMQEARILLKGCLDGYAKKNLAAGELELYLNLSDERHAAAFRICRSLAVCESDSSVPPPEFFLSASQLAARLGVLDMSAWRILKTLREMGCFEITRNGDRRATGKKAAATHFRWCFPLSVVK